MAQDFDLSMPTERAEKYLAKMAKQYDGTLPEPISNIDKYLKILAENGTGGGSGGGITPKKLENIDLNTVTETGSYYADFDHTCKNVPNKVGSYGFSIIVTNGGGVVYQLLMKNTIAEENRLFMRVIDSDGEVYPWSNYMQESDVIVDSVLSETSTRPPQNAIVTKRLNEIESNSAKRNHTHTMIVNSNLRLNGAENAAQWVMLGTLVSSGNFTTSVVRVWTGDGANARTNQNASFEIHIKDAWQSPLSVDNACGVTVYRINCVDVKVKVIPTAHDTYTVWVYLPWTYWNGNFEIRGLYKSWETQLAKQDAEPDGTGANTAYYDYAFSTSTVAKATEAETLTDSGWIRPEPICVYNLSVIKYRKYGKCVTITGFITLAKDYTDAKIFQLPEDCRSSNNVFTLGSTIDPPYDYFPVKISNDGYVTFIGKTENFFKKLTDYAIQLTFFVD
nr:MAG TPA: hypothetical protein [Caudoviricetes sp.]